MNAAKKAEKEQEKEQMPDFMKKAEEYFSNNRKIFLWNQVDDESAGKIVKQLLYLDSLSHDDIVFFINLDALENRQSGDRLLGQRDSIENERIGNCHFEPLLCVVADESFHLI